ncbi:hypothetical protein NQ315_011717 [Exocentrus adspersus]|uniref:BBSome-interacting protein 1 n=1 Tax=Exocentrus adspersus TaxID=1586481 RepID=A0AAV8W0G6_9CUCU|nr:hypothetical protein NQ315_011717 [Exocentrus adspersus]
MSETAPLKPILKSNPQIMLEDAAELVLCKPRLIPLKSFTLEKLEKMQQEAEKARQQVNSDQNE